MFVLVYDNSFEGLLSAIFEVYEYKFNPVSIYKTNRNLPLLFTEIKKVETVPEKANRVYQKLHEILGKEGMRKIVYAFLSEDAECEDHILNAVKYVLATKDKRVLQDLSHPSVFRLMQYEKSVSRERHRMTAFVRFRLLEDGIFYAEVEPDFNVLPLISSHFKERYKDQSWVIYDKRRKFGIYYNLKQVEFITFEFTDSKSASDYSNPSYEILWRTYFTSTNIQARKNTRLHHQHVPKRYWKYLTEKQLF